MARIMRISYNLPAYLPTRLPQLPGYFLLLLQDRGTEERDTTLASHEEKEPLIIEPGWRVYQNDGLSPYETSQLVSMQAWDKAIGTRPYSE